MDNTSHFSYGANGEMTREQAIELVRQLKPFVHVEYNTRSGRFCRLKAGFFSRIADCLVTIFDVTDGLSDEDEQPIGAFALHWSVAGQYATLNTIEALARGIVEDMELKAEVAAWIQRHFGGLADEKLTNFFVGYKANGGSSWQKRVRDYGVAMLEHQPPQDHAVKSFIWAQVQALCGRGREMTCGELALAEKNDWT